MLRSIFGTMVTSACIFTLACTNDYDDMAYVPEQPQEPQEPQEAELCENDRDCSGAEQCNQGQCSCAGAPACERGETCCPFQGCRDLDDDSQHCGGCGDECPNGLSCNNGVCGL